MVVLVVLPWFLRARPAVLLPTIDGDANGGDGGAARVVGPGRNPRHAFPLAGTTQWAGPADCGDPAVRRQLNGISWNATAQVPGCLRALLWVFVADCGMGNQ